MQRILYTGSIFIVSLLIWQQNIELLLERSMPDWFAGLMIYGASLIIVDFHVNFRQPKLHHFLIAGAIAPFWPITKFWYWVKRPAKKESSSDQ